MRIYIVRHGETKENKERIFQGHLPGDLSKKGIKESQKLKDYFKKITLDHIFCSDLKRAKDTLKEILKFHPQVPVTYTKILREKDYGIFSGTPRKKIEESIAKKEFELKDSLYARANKVSKKILEGKYKKVLILGHGTINKFVITSILKKDEAFRKNLPRIHNSSISIIDFVNNKSAKLVSFSSIEHLKDL